MPKITSLLKYSGIRPVIASPCAGTAPVFVSRWRWSPSSAASMAIRRTGSIWWVCVGGVDVIQDRAAAGEALHPEQLLGVEAAVGGAVLGVTLRRDAAVGDVVHGRRASWVRRSV